MNSYSIAVAGNVPSRDNPPTQATDVAKANLFISGAPVATIDVTPGSTYAFPAQTVAEEDRPDDGLVLVEVQFEDASGNQGPKRGQVTFLADKQAPGLPPPYTIVTTLIQIP